MIKMEFVSLESHKQKIKFELFVSNIFSFFDTDFTNRFTFYHN